MGLRGAAQMSTATQTFDSGLASKCASTDSNHVDAVEPIRSTFSTSLHRNHRYFSLGVCAMQSKVRSKPMQSILKRLEKSSDFRIVEFSEKMILEEDISAWPTVDALIAFYSSGYPLEKTLCGSYGPGSMCFVSCNNKEHYDYIVYNGLRLNKPFIEKPENSDDHNNYVYYPRNTGGGCKKLFRKVKDRSSEFYPNVHSVRRDGTYVYEEFLSTQGTDVKVYTVGQVFAHAEARKSPTLDGKVQRTQDGKEVRYPVILTEAEKLMAYKIVQAFGQRVCGFDILRTTSGQSVVCDVNGWSFVKGNSKYYNDCAYIIRILFLNQLQEKHHFIMRELPDGWLSSVEAEEAGNQALRRTFAECDDTAYTKPNDEELCSVVVVMRHGDRKPKQKLKFEASEPEFLAYHSRAEQPANREVKLKSPEELQDLLERTKQIIARKEQALYRHMVAHDSDPGYAGSCYAPETDVVLLDQLRMLQSVLEGGDGFTGINRKFQIKPTRWSFCRENEDTSTDGENIGPTVPKNVRSMTFDYIPSTRGFLQVFVARQLIVAKWGGELTRVGRAQAEDLGQRLRVAMYPGDDGGLLRLHSTFRHDFKIFTSDEGRCQVTSASFTKGFLDLEGELTPILVQMVTRNAKAHALLDSSVPASECRDRCKKALDILMNSQGTVKEIVESNLEAYPELSTVLVSVDGTIEPKKELFQIQRLMEQLISALGSQIQSFNVALKIEQSYSGSVKSPPDLRHNSLVHLGAIVVRSTGPEATAPHDPLQGSELLESDVEASLTEACTELRKPEDVSGPPAFDTGSPTFNNDFPELDSRPPIVDLKPSDFGSEPPVFDLDVPDTLEASMSEKGSSVASDLERKARGANNEPYNRKSQELLSRPSYHGLSTADCVAHARAASNGSYTGSRCSSRFHNARCYCASGALVRVALQRLKEIVYRWQELHDSWYRANLQRFDISKIPDLVDNVRFDLIHHHWHLGEEGLRLALEISNIAGPLCALVAPAEYGFTAQQKVEIGTRSVSRLMKKILRDLTVSRANTYVEPGLLSVTRRADISDLHAVPSPPIPTKKHTADRSQFRNDAQVSELVTIKLDGTVANGSHGEEHQPFLETGSADLIPLSSCIPRSISASALQAHLPFANIMRPVDPSDASPAIYDHVSVAEPKRYSTETKPAAATSKKIDGPLIARCDGGSKDDSASMIDNHCNDKSADVVVPGPPRVSRQSSAPHYRPRPNAVNRSSPEIQNSDSHLIHAEASAARNSVAGIGYKRFPSSAKWNDTPDVFADDVSPQEILCEDFSEERKAPGLEPWTDQTMLKDPFRNPKPSSSGDRCTTEILENKPSKTLERVSSSAAGEAYWLLPKKHATPSVTSSMKECDSRGRDADVESGRLLTEPAPFSVPEVAKSDKSSLTAVDLASNGTSHPENRHKEVTIINSDPLWSHQLPPFKEGLPSSSAAGVTVSGVSVEKPSEIMSGDECDLASITPSTLGDVTAAANSRFPYLGGISSSRRRSPSSLSGPAESCLVSSKNKQFDMEGALYVGYSNQAPLPRQKSAFKPQRSIADSMPRYPTSSLCKMPSEMFIGKQVDVVQDVIRQPATGRDIGQKCNNSASNLRSLEPRDDADGGHSKDNDECSSDNEDDETNFYRLKEEEAKQMGIRSPWRIVRSRYYIASASHIISLFNILTKGKEALNEQTMHSRHAGADFAHEPTNETLGSTTLSEFGDDVHYLSHIVFRVWERKKVPVTSEDRYRLEVLFSSGAKDGFGGNCKLMQAHCRNQQAVFQQQLEHLMSHHKTPLPSEGLELYPERNSPPQGRSKVADFIPVSLQGKDVQDKDASTTGSSCINVDSVPPYCEISPLVRLDHGNNSVASVESLFQALLRRYGPSQHGSTSRNAGSGSASD